MAITDADLLIQINDRKGGSGGQLLLSDVTFSGSRDNSLIYGIGNKTPQDVDPGNKEFTLSVEQYMTEEGAKLLREIVRNEKTAQNRQAITTELSGTNTGGSTIDAAYLLFGNSMEATIGDFRWNNFEVSASEDGEVQVSMEVDCLNVSINNPSTNK